VAGFNAALQRDHRAVPLAEFVTALNTHSHDRNARSQRGVRIGKSIGRPQRHTKPSVFMVSISKRSMTIKESG
jgi:hypothetical protein